MSQIQNSTKNKECKHLSFAERKIIEKSLKSGLSPREIAANLFRSKSTNSREIKYSPDVIVGKARLNRLFEHIPFQEHNL